MSSRSLEGHGLLSCSMRRYYMEFITSQENPSWWSPPATRIVHSAKQVVYTRGVPWRMTLNDLHDASNQELLHRLLPHSTTPATRPL